MNTPSSSSKSDTTSNVEQADLPHLIRVNVTTDDTLENKNENQNRTNPTSSDESIPHSTVNGDDDDDLSHHDEAPIVPGDNGLEETTVICPGPTPRRRLSKSNPLRGRHHGVRKQRSPQSTISCNTESIIRWMGEEPFLSAPVFSATSTTEATRVNFIQRQLNSEALNSFLNAIVEGMCRCVNFDDNNVDK